MKNLKWCIIYESSPLRFTPVIYIQPDGGYLDFAQIRRPYWRRAKM